MVCKRLIKWLNRVHIRVDMYPKMTNRVHIVLCLLLILLATACGTVKYIPVENVHTEYVDKIREIHDTLLLSDKETVYVNGDTIRIVRYVDRYRTVYRQDTVHIERTDTIAKPYPVERKMSLSEKTDLFLGKVFKWLVLFISAVILVRYAYNKYKCKQ